MNAKILLVLFGLVAAAAGCGRQYFPMSRVIGGKNANRNSWPWQVVFLENGRPGCGGSIISPNWIVTAAHCVVTPQDQRKSAWGISVRVGKHDLRRRDQFEVEHRASQIFVHPGFSYRHFQNDVAVIRLATPIRFNQAVQPICLPKSAARVGQPCYITGWGRQHRSARGMHHTLQQAPMPVVDPRTCSNAMRRVAPFPIGPHSICSGYGRARISGCQGDSGGPFVCNNGRNWELHGAVSWGSRDCSARANQYTVYANIYNLKRWISQTTGVY